MSKAFSIVQGIVIILNGISIFDNGYAANGDDPDGIGFNKALFDDPSEWWNIFSFWGYCFLVVGLMQLLKALSSD
ncbi:MAG: hypothetical protein ACW98K_08095 [Candidatus Kariarchaeaceae archaeon]|jgi:hypothetical protein